MPSNLVFTPPAGLGIGIKKTPKWNTIKKTAASGYQLRTPLQQYPLWEIELPFNYLKGDEARASAYQYLLGFYLAMQGAAISFLFEDQYDNTCAAVAAPGSTLGLMTNQQGEVAMGDGTSTTFQLIRQIGIGYDIVQNPATITPYVNGSPVSSSAWTLDYAGTITFTSAPTSGSVLNWAGTFYYRVHFLEDSLDDLQMILSDCWELGSCKLESDLI